MLLEMSMTRITSVLKLWHIGVAGVAVGVAVAVLGGVPVLVGVGVEDSVGIPVIVGMAVGV
jgi:hypothetical protein